MRSRWLLVSLLLGSVVPACGASKDGYVVLDVDADSTVDKAMISQLQVSAGSVTRDYPLTTALPGSLGVVSSHQGKLDLSVVAVGRQVSQGYWTGEVTITAGRTVHVPVNLSCKGGSCGTAVSQDAGTDAGSGLGGSGVDASGGTGGDGGSTVGTGGADGGAPDGIGCPGSPSCRPFSKIRCGNSDTCDNTTQVCCRRSLNVNDPTADLDFHCAAIGSCRAPDTLQQSCNGSINCGVGQSCALTTVDGLSAFACVDTTTAFADLTTSTTTVLCHAQTECPTNYECTPAMACIEGVGAPTCTPNPLQYLSSCTSGTGAAGSGGPGGSGGGAGSGGTSGEGGSGGTTTTPAVRSSVWGQADPPSADCTLANVSSGDVLFAGVHTSGAPSAISASDDHGDTFQSLTTSFNVRAGDFVGGAFAKATASGSVKITVSVGTLSENPNTRSGLSLFCYDLAGVATTPMGSSGIGTGTTSSVSNPMTVVSNNSVAIAIWEMYGSLSPPTIAPGPGFTITPGSSIAAHSTNYVGSEYSLLHTGGAATTCSMTMSVSEFWDGMCFVFAPSQ